MAETELVRIERAVYGGSGLARTASGAVTFVPFVLPGELVEIETSASGNEASLVRVLEPAAERVAPACPHFGRCGGCHYQHANYDEQLRLKQGILAETMERSGVSEFGNGAPHSSEPWEYRNRVRFRISEVDGELRCGYSVRGTNEFLPIEVCPISAPILVRAAFALLALAKSDAKSRVWIAGAKEVEFFINDASTQLNMTLFVVMKNSHPKGSFQRLCEALRNSVPELGGAGAVSAQASVSSRSELESWGTAGLAYRVQDESYWISRGGFFQVNRFLVASLVSLVCKGRAGKLAWDLYAGVGLFSRVLARSFEQVVAVEANATAIADLRPALGKIGPQHRAAQEATLAFLYGALVQRERPDLIVLDPPRAGAGIEACRVLLQLAAAEMVYVSCDPTTLARDLAVLQQGYAVSQMNLVDLFPQTFHMETVVVLTRR